MNRSSSFILACSLSLALAGSAALGRSAPASPIVGKTAVTVYPLDREIALALDAAPAHLRDGAGVYALEASGFVLVRKSANGFNCIVNRDGPHNEKPVCFDPVGSKTVLPVDVRVGDLLLAGVGMRDINAEIAMGFKTGKYHVADLPGVAYMLSNHNYDYDPASNTINVFPPHVMFYAPYLTDKDIGSKGDFAYGLPSIGYQGPVGFMIVPCGAYCEKPLSSSM
jgi:hypothetical protein